MTHPDPTRLAACSATLPGRAAHLVSAWAASRAKTGPRPRRDPPSGRDGGFILLEAVIALVIAVAALAAIFAIVNAGLRSAAVADRYEVALSRAQSHLAAIGRGEAPLIPGTQQGEDGDGFRWQVRITQAATAPLATPAATGAAAPGSVASATVAPGHPAGQAALPPPAAGPPRQVALYTIRVGITWTEDGQARQVWLSSERAGTASPPPP